MGYLREAQVFWQQIRADLRYAVGSVSDPRNKVNIATHKVFGFPVHINIMFTLYCVL